MGKKPLILFFSLLAGALAADPWTDYASGLEGPASREKFILAASAWESGELARQPEALFNAALGWMRADQPEKALAPLRKYLSLRPWDSRAWDLIRSARIWGELKDPGGMGLWYLDWKTWYLTALSLMSLPFLAWTAWRIYRGTRGRKILLIPLLLVLGTGGAFLEPPWPGPGQLKVSVQGRRGDGEFFPPVQNTLWSAGQEVWILEQKPSWSRVQVGNLTAWVPDDLVRQF